MGRQLQTYRKKRNFSFTAEPRGKLANELGNSFVVQKHDARRLHYDFRLELDGVLKSWAVTRGPSLVPSEKRLAVHVEDHPIEYAKFEGTIPKGEYGGGTVIVWDRGYWTPIGDPKKQYNKGHLEFELHGQKLKGQWHLVRMKGKPDEKREHWLLIKGEDEFSKEPKDVDILKAQPNSIATGRSIADVEGEKPGWSSRTGKILKQDEEGEKRTAENPQKLIVSMKLAEKRKQPDFIEPELAKLYSSAPKGERWLHEIKFDGYRIQAHISSDGVRLFSRGGLDWTEKFGTRLTKELLSLPVKNAIFDGEIVIENQSGISDFSALQDDLSEGRTDRFVYYIFDVLYLDGYDLRQAPLMERKKALQGIVAKDYTWLRLSESFEFDGSQVLQNACELGLEGIISKLRDSPYESGRTTAWRKSKCVGRQEFVVAGFVPSTTNRNAIGSLLLGVYDDGKLLPVGRVGTGFPATVAKDLFKQLNVITQEKSPYAVPLKAEERRGAVFVQPSVVAEVEYRAWTADKRLRHASFRGLREDKSLNEIVGETGAELSTSSSTLQSKETNVKLTHPDRIYWPDAGVTKLGLANYYAEVWPRIEPFITNRALALLRCPTGIEGEHFFQKHAWKGLNEHIVEVTDPKDKDGGTLISIKNFGGLIGLVQSAVLEIHPWGSTVKNWEKPDTLTMDLDPGDDVPWQLVIDAALETKARLEKYKLVPFIKTSGGKGLHVVVPLKPSLGWADLKSFTKATVDQMVADSPDRYVSTISKEKRRGKILIDYLRNQRGMTAVAPYSPRARRGAAISMPIDWAELGPQIGPAHFTILNVVARLSSKNDPWEGFRKAEVPLPKSKGKA